MPSPSPCSSSYEPTRQVMMSVCVCERTSDQQHVVRAYTVCVCVCVCVCVSHKLCITHTGAAGQADTRKGTRDKGTWSGESPSVHRRGTIHTQKDAEEVLCRLKKTLTIHTHTHTKTQTHALSLSLSLTHTHTITGTRSGGSLSPRKCDLLGSGALRCMSESCSY